MKSILVFSMVLLMSSISGAHGEDKPGPHGGYVRMPGAFHTELVPNSDVQFKIYLLDINWKNPSVKNSQIIIKYIGKAGSESVTCRQEVDSFVCQLSQALTLQNGKLSVKATRENSVGAEVFYNLPLNFSNGGGHGSH